jgi:N-acetylmuramoyl-L-alanine amidase
MEREKKARGGGIREKVDRRRFMGGMLLGSGLLAGALALQRLQHRWRHIVIHHSAGNRGSVRLLNRVHRQRQPGDAVDSMAYHFAIGNGNGMPMGAVAHHLRWRLGLWGAHVSARNAAVNISGIGICLVGNFEKRPVPRPQYLALLALCRRLMDRYAIPPTRVVVHRELPGEKTKCPGRFFPARLLARDLLRPVTMATSAGKGSAPLF